MAPSGVAPTCSTGASTWMAGMMSSLGRPGLGPVATAAALGAEGAALAGGCDAAVGAGVEAAAVAEGAVCVAADGAVEDGAGAASLGCGGMPQAASRQPARTAAFRIPLVTGGIRAQRMPYRTALISHRRGRGYHLLACCNQMI